MIKTKRLVNLQVKLKAAKAERTIRLKERNAAMRGMKKIETTIGVLDEKIGKLLEVGKQPACDDVGTGGAGDAECRA